jgi:hypothetical protein
MRLLIAEASAVILRQVPAERISQKARRVQHMRLPQATWLDGLQQITMLYCSGAAAGNHSSGKPARRVGHLAATVAPSRCCSLRRRPLNRTDRGRSAFNSARNLLAAEAAAGVRHHFALSIVATDRSLIQVRIRFPPAERQAKLRSRRNDSASAGMSPSDLPVTEN